MCAQGRQFACETINGRFLFLFELKVHLRRCHWTWVTHRHT
jgi:predicted metalloenzyme YecM